MADDTMLSVMVTVCEKPDEGMIVIVPVYWPTANPAELIIAVRVVGVLPCVVLTASYCPPLLVVAIVMNGSEVVPLARLISCRAMDALPAV